MSTRRSLAIFIVALSVPSRSASALDNIQLKGSDSLDPLTTEVIAKCPGAAGLSFAGGGLEGGEVAMVSGTQQIAPMSQRLRARSCGVSGGASATNLPFSKTPDGVRQELWGIALAYNLVRVEMERAAAEAGVPPTRISFVAALAMIREEFFWLGSPRVTPGAIPASLQRLRRQLKRLVLPPRRPERSYPRAVKLKMSNYPRKRLAKRTAK